MNGEQKKKEETPQKYKLGNVGITRHPEIYLASHSDEVIPNVETELAMWKLAEKIHKLILDSGGERELDLHQLCFVNHYVMALFGVTYGHEYSALAYMQFRILTSISLQQALGMVGHSARQQAKDVLKARDRELAKTIKLAGRRTTDKEE